MSPPRANDASASRLRLVFVGDVMLGRGVNEFLQWAGADYPWGDTKTLFQAADWRACNLECVISDRGTPWARTPKAFHFRSDARNVAVLQAAAIDAVSLANNHTLDFEYAAMFEMLKLLDQAGIQRAGAGADIAEAARPAIRGVKGAAIGMIAFTDNEPQWEAGPRRPGVFYSPIDIADERARMLFETIRETRKRANLIVVSAHWGPNWGYQPLAGHIRFSHALIDAGTDIVFGHSGHVFQGVELYGGHPIMYCTGNFVDDYAVDEVERNDESFVFTLEIGRGRMIRMLLHPTVIADCQARMASGTRAEEIAGKMARLCKDFDTPVRWLKKRELLEISTH